MKTDVNKVKINIKGIKSFVVILCVALICSCGYLMVQTLRIVKSSTVEAYDKTHKEVSEKYYKWAFQKAEEKYHVSNKVSISIGDIREQSKLEVLKVSDVEFVIHNADEEDGNITAWLAFPGYGIFTVDMSLSEFVVDNERYTVIARVPKPQLTSLKIEDENIEIYNLSTGRISNGDYSQGQTQANEHMKEAGDMMEKEFLSNQQYLLSAEKSAKIVIAEFVKSLNPEVEQLNVVVEFVD